MIQMTEKKVEISIEIDGHVIWSGCISEVKVTISDAKEGLKFRKIREPKPNQRE
jgi:hypothetical protein